MARTRPRSRHTIFSLSAVLAILAGAVSPLLAPATAVPAVAAGCPIISGYVYYDQNFNGIMDPGETPIPGSLIELRNAQGVMVGSVATDSNGYYQFNNDITANKAEQTANRTLVFPTAVTDWAATREAAQFDPSLGTLTSVDVVHTATITSAIKAESLDADPTTVTANVSGTLTLTGPGGRTFSVTPNVAAGSFDAAIYDGNPDFAGPSGHDFGQHSASDSSTTTITDAPSLSLYTGTGSLSFTERAAASSNTTGGGNVLNQINTTAGGQVVLTYHYVPITCLKPGTYTIVQPNEPPGYSDGFETSGNLAPIPGTVGTDRISVTVTTSDLPNNNFGEVKASLSGYVYYSPSGTCTKDPGDPGIQNVLITLTGTDWSGQPVSKTTTTNASGFYSFPGLTAGTYTITETQPAGYLDGKDTIGSQGGTTQNDRFTNILLAGGVNGVNNNFCELLPPTPTPPPTPPGGTQTPGPSGTPGTNGTGTPPRGSQTVPISGTGTATPIDQTRGERTPGPPGTGGGLVSHTQFNIALAAVILLGVSGWLAYIGAGKRRTAEAAIGDEDAGFGPDEP